MRADSAPPPPSARVIKRSDSFSHRCPKQCENQSTLFLALVGERLWGPLFLFLFSQWLRVQRNFNQRTDGGADIRPPPRRFFVDNGKTAARSAAKFGMTIPSSLLHMMCKFWLPNLKGQVTRSVWMTRPHIILQLWDRVRARVDDLGLWNLQDIMNL